MKTKITQIPMYPSYDSTTKTFTGPLSHIDYEGETRYIWSNPVAGSGVRTTEPYTYIPNDPFEDELTYKGYYRGRSAAGMIFENKAGQKFTVFLTDFEPMVPIMEKGVVKSTFIYCKRGRNYGLKLYV